MKRYLAIALLLSSTVQASWMEFCNLSGEVVSKIGNFKHGKKFQLKVKKAEKLSVTRGGLHFSSYTDCQNHIGRVYEVFYSGKKYLEAGQPKRGESHCSSYTVEDWGEGALVHWEPGCGNG